MMNRLLLRSATAPLSKQATLLRRLSTVAAYDLETKINLNPARYQANTSTASRYVNVPEQHSRSHINNHEEISTSTREEESEDRQQAMNDLIYCLSFASEESDFLRNCAAVLEPNKLQQLQLRNSRQQLSRHRHTVRKTPESLSWQQQEQQHKKNTYLDTDPLPRTLSDALRKNSHRAIVITEAVAPFRVVDVNAAWEHLCGYTYLESVNKTLGSLLQGEKTDTGAATLLIAKLLQGEPEAGTTLINYTKQGRPFLNRIRVGPLVQETKDGKLNKVTHFVGVLQEMKN